MIWRMGGTGLIASILAGALLPSVAALTEHVVTNTGDGLEEGTLRTMLVRAAQDNDDSLISFNIPPDVSPIIEPLSELALPPSTTIDGTTQPGSGGVFLVGRNAPAGVYGLRSVAGGCTIRGMVIMGFRAGGFCLRTVATMSFRGAA